MKIKTDQQMCDEMMADGQLERMKSLLKSIHGGNTDAVKAANELFEHARTLHDQAIRKGYNQFDVFEQMIVANEQVALDAAMAGSSAAGAIKL